MSNADEKTYAEKLELYERLVATIPEVERKGKTMPYTSCNGNMFSFLTKTGTLALRLPEQERTKFIEAYNSRLCEQHGTVMKEYAEVPDELLKNNEKLQAYFADSYAYVGSLKPKPTKRPATKKT